MSEPAVRGEDPQKPGEPTARRHPPGPEPPASPAPRRDEAPDDDGREGERRR